MARGPRVADTCSSLFYVFYLNSLQANQLVFIKTLFFIRHNSKNLKVFNNQMFCKFILFLEKEVLESSKRLEY